MKVIKEGKWTVPWQQEIVCIEPQCGAQLLAEEADVIAPDYEYVDVFKVACPVCGTSVFLKDKDLPRRVKDVLNKKRKNRISSNWD